MRQYVNFQDTREKIPLLVSQIDSFEYIVVENEHESLVLEKNLIQQYSPYFNADFKDDNELYRSLHSPPAMYFRLSNTRAKLISLTRAISVPILIRVPRATLSTSRAVSCPSALRSCAEWRRLTRRLENCSYDELELSDRPCFDAHVGLGPGACCGAIDPEEYQLLVKRVARFLSGQHKEFLDELEESMQAAVAELDFEAGVTHQRPHRYDQFA